jgi:CRP-like cAMP-binding protein
MNQTIDLELTKALIKKQTCFNQLTSEETEGLANLFSVAQIGTGKDIVIEGDAVDSVYLIVSGTADVRHVTEDGFQSLATLGPGQAIGLNETGFYSLTGRRTATVVATSDMVLLSLSVVAFRGFALASHHVFELMHRDLTPDTFEDM